MSKKLGVVKGRSVTEKTHERVHTETVAHPHVPGRAYEITDPSQKLIAMIGGGFFNEPKYYDPNRSTVAFYNELLTTGKISSNITDALGLSAQAKEVIETAHAVANSDHPEDLLVIASWARDTKKGLKLRYTPQIMAVIAAANDKTKPFLPKYATSIVQRADEIRQVFGAFRHLFHNKDAKGLYKGTLPHALRKFLAVALANTKAYSLVKYNAEDRPTFGDVILMLRGNSLRHYVEKATGRKTQHWPVSKGMFEYLVNGKVTEDAPEILKARTAFFKLKDKSEVTPELLEKAGLTWENIVSHFGSSKEIWEMAIPFMGEQALTRNLRNFEGAGISDKAWDAVYAKCTSITDTKQLPFQFFAAEGAVAGTNAKSISDKLLDNSCMNVPELSGVTAIFVDNSGSCTSAACSGKSTLRVSDAGNTLAAIIAKRLGRRAKVGVFGDSFIWVPFSEADSCMATKKKIDSVAHREDRAKNGALAIHSTFARGHGVGAGTETGLWCGIHDLTEKGIKVDRIIICSDFCCYTQGDACNCGQDMNRYFGKGGEKATIQSMLDVYRRKVNPNCYVHSIDLQGHGKGQVRPGDSKTQLLSGWSEQVFGLVRGFELGSMSEQVTQQSEQPAEVPTIELLRQQYQL